MKPMLTAFAACLTFAALPANAADAPAEPAAAEAAPADPLSFNIGLFTQYRFRGISQTRSKVAVQGGADYAHESGFYVGAWASNIKWIKDYGGDAGAEIDLYGGYKFELVKGLNVDVGGLYYLYPNNKFDSVPGFTDANTFELYGSLNYGPVTVKYSHSLTDAFGNINSKNSGYLEAAVNIDLGDGLALVPHIGHQRIKNGSFYSYTDYSFTISKDWSGLVLAGTIVGTDSNRGAYVGGGRELGGTTLVVSIKKTF